MFTVYILFSNSLDKFYVGFTNDIERRLLEHNRKKGKYTDAGIPWILVYREEYELKSEAMSREKQIKLQKSRQYIVSLLSSSAGRYSVLTEGSWVRPESLEGHHKTRRSHNGFSFLDL